MIPTKKTYAAYCASCEYEVRYEDSGSADRAARNHAAKHSRDPIPHVVYLQHLTVADIGAYTLNGWKSFA